MPRKKIKVVMLGEGRVGKTSLLHRFVNNVFDEECVSTTKATMYANSKIEVGDTTADVAIWDTAGQERYHALGPIYYRDAHGAVLAYDITDRDSFDKVKVWLKELHQVVGDNIQIVIVGNKCDLERDRKVNKREADEWAQLHNAPHFLCSAKLGLKVADAFTTLVRNIVTTAAADKTSANRTPSSHATPATGSRSRGVKITMDETAGAAPVVLSQQAPPEKKPCAC